MLTHLAERFTELERAKEGGGASRQSGRGGLERARVQGERGYTLKEAIEREKASVHVCVCVCPCIHANFSLSWSQRPLSSFLGFFF